MKIVYLHGFASVGEGNKSQIFKNFFGAEHVTAPDLPVNPSQVINIVNDIVRQNNDYPLIFVGTSLGGFWANYFAQKWDVPCVIVNPSTRPSISLKKYQNANIKNNVTQKPVEVTSRDITEYEKIEKYLATNTNGALINMFIAKDDEVISPHNASEDIPFAASIVMKDNGGHRFEMHWNDVVTKIQELLK